MTDSLLDPLDGGHSLRGPETWALIRHDYLAGGSARLIAERYGVSESALRTRARNEGWRKGDRPDPDWASEDEEAYDPSAPPPSAAEIAATARWEAARALRLRRPVEAERWTRLHERWSALARAEAAEAENARRSEEKRRREEDRAAVERITRDARALEMKNRARSAELGLEIKEQLAQIAAAQLPAARPDLQPLQPLHPVSDTEARLAELDREIADRKRRGLPAGKLVRERDQLRRGLRKLE